MVTYGRWSDLIQESFEKSYYVPLGESIPGFVFDPEHALGALKLADEALRGPMGMRTLDPSDLQYRPYYDNSNDSNDAAVAKGRNYHQVSTFDSVDSCLR